MSLFGFETDLAKRIIVHADAVPRDKPTFVIMSQQSTSFVAWDRMPKSLKQTWCSFKKLETPILRKPHQPQVKLRFFRLGKGPQLLRLILNYVCKLLSRRFHWYTYVSVYQWNWFVLRNGGSVRGGTVSSFFFLLARSALRLRKLKKKLRVLVTFFERPTFFAIT